MSNDKGFIKLSRKFFTNTYWNQKRTFSLSEAWLDLIQLARFEERPTDIILANGREISIKRGEIRASLRFLSDRWGWGVEKTKKFIDKHIEKQEIERRTEQGESIIKLCKYDSYNPSSNTDQYTEQYTDQYADRTPTNTVTSTNKKKDKKVKNEKKEEEILPPTPPKGGGDSLNSKARSLFEDYYRNVFQSDYYWTAKDAGSMAQIIKKLEYQRKQKNMEITDDAVLYALKYLLGSISEGWIYENFSVPNINSKFNELISQAKNGKSTGSIRTGGNNSYGSAAANKEAGRQALDQLADAILEQHSAKNRS